MSARLQASVMAGAVAFVIGVAIIGAGTGELPVRSVW